METPLEAINHKLSKIIELEYEIAEIIEKFNIPILFDNIKLKISTIGMQNIIAHHKEVNCTKCKHFEGCIVGERILKYQPDSYKMLKNIKPARF